MKLHPPHIETDRLHLRPFTISDAAKVQELAGDKKIYDTTLARERFIARGLAEPQRERFHRDIAVTAARENVTLPLGAYDPPHLPFPSLHVNTTHDYRPTIEEITAFARERISG